MVVFTGKRKPSVKLLNELFDNHFRFVWANPWRNHAVHIQQESELERGHSKHCGKRCHPCQCALKTCHLSRQNVVIDQVGEPKVGNFGIPNHVFSLSSRENSRVAFCSLWDHEKACFLRRDHNGFTLFLLLFV